MVDANELHLKYVLGESLLPDELQLLEEWYLQQDAQESTTLGIKIPLGTVENVQWQIDSLFEQIAQEMAQIRKLAQENIEIKAENEMLRSQLVQSAA